jgi:hypothetical protein
MTTSWSCRWVIITFHAGKTSKYSYMKEAKYLLMSQILQN